MHARSDLMASDRRTVGEAGASVDVAVLRRLALVAARINSGQELTDTLQAVADAVTEVTDFTVAAVNYINDRGDLDVVAVAGSDDVRQALLGMTWTAAELEQELALADVWGALRFIPHDRVSHLPGWYPSYTPLDVADAWHPDDTLFIPLTSTAGALVGVLSVDMPASGLRPGVAQREVLEAFGVQAGIAIDHAALTARLRREESRLRASEASFRFSFTASASGMALISLAAGDAGRLLQVNDALCATLGLESQELVGRRWDEFVHVLDLPESLSTLARLAAGERGDYRGERRLLRHDGQEIWVTVSETVVDPGDGRPPFLVANVEDITERRRREESLRHLADHDELTSLPTRRIAHQRLAAAAARARATGRPGVLLFCDLDHFKAVNDRLGHAAGDRALTEAAARMLSQVRSRDTVARLGGDEFVVVAEDLDAAGVTRLVERLRDALTAPLSEIDARIGVSIGRTVIDGQELDADTLLHRADRAMYAQKAGMRATL